MQLALRQVFVSTGTYALVTPELLVPQARDKSDADGDLANESVRERIRPLIEALVAPAHRLRAD